MLTNSNILLENSYINSNFRIFGVKGSSNIFNKSKEILLEYEKAGNKLKDKIKDLMEEQIDSLESKIIREIGEELKKKEVKKMIGLGDVADLNLVLIGDILNIVSLLDKDIYNIKNIKQFINFNLTKVFKKYTNKKSDSKKYNLNEKT